MGFVGIVFSTIVCGLIYYGSFGFANSEELNRLPEIASRPVTAVVVGMQLGYDLSQANVVTTSQATIAVATAEEN